MLFLGYNGHLYNNGEKLVPFPSFTHGDYITCRYDRKERTLSFGKNGEEPRVAFDELPNDMLYPCVLFYSLSPGEKVKYVQSDSTRFDKAVTRKGVLNCKLNV